MATNRYTDNPRARTQRGNDSWAAAFNVVIVISHAIPDSTRNGIAAANGSHATATVATPYPGGGGRQQQVVRQSQRMAAATATASTAPKPTAATAMP